LSIDEVALSKGELYTFLTNKSGKGKRGSLVAVIKGTLSKDIIEVLEQLPLEKRLLVKEVTLDMAKNMEKSIKKSFERAALVTDRFHVIRLAQEALQHIRVKLRWEEMDQENERIKLAKQFGTEYKAEELSNDETPKQLLARSRYLLSRKENDWTETQSQRATLLFERYPILYKAYQMVLEFRNIYEERNKQPARNRFDKWVEAVINNKIIEFNTVANTIKNNLENILNFFDNRNTNANAESFNSKIKLFRANLRGVVDTKFFLFRLHKLFA
jgi:transposase